MAKPDLAIAARIVRLSTDWQSATARFLSLIKACDRERGPDRNILALHDSPLNAAYREWTTASLALSLTCVFQYGWWTADFPHRANPHLVRYVSSVGTSHDLEMLRTCIATMRGMADRAADCARRELLETRGESTAQAPDTPVPTVKMAVSPSSELAAASGNRDRLPDATGLRKPALPTTLKELATDIRAKSSRSRNVPSLLELIHDRTQSVSKVTMHFDEIGDKCHGALVEPDTIKKTLIGARKAIVSAGLPYRLNQSGSNLIVQKIST
jgi:hypothetical protein